jgi:molybdate transport system regulatory protein
MNNLPGTIRQVETAGGIALIEVEVNGHLFTALMAGTVDSTWTAGTPVVLQFKETEVSLAKNLSGLLSMRNRFSATVTAIERGQILTRVSLDFLGRSLQSIITTRSSHTLSLAVGDQVEGLVKSNEMSLMTALPPQRA